MKVERRGGGQEADTCRYGASKDLADVSYGEVKKLRRHMAAAAGKKKYDLLVFVHGSIRPRSGRKALHQRLLSTGQKSTERRNGVTSKKQLGRCRFERFKRGSK